MVFFGTTSNLCTELAECTERWFAGTLKLDLSSFKVLRGNDRIYYLDARKPYIVETERKERVKHDHGFGAQIIRIQVTRGEAVAIVLRGQSFLNSA